MQRYTELQWTEGCRTVTLQQQKRQTYSEPRTERVEWDISIENVNVNVLINFIVCDAKTSICRQRNTPL